MAIYNKDLTRDEWLQDVDADDEGTGIYLLRDPDGNYEKLFSPNMNRRDCDRLADQLDRLPDWDLRSYKWVPDQIEDFGRIATTICGGECQGKWDCVRPACDCIDRRCTLKGK